MVSKGEKNDVEIRVREAKRRRNVVGKTSRPFCILYATVSPVATRPRARKDPATASCSRLNWFRSLQHRPGRGSLDMPSGTPLCADEVMD